MPAPNFIQLYNFSETFEAATLGVLQGAGVAAYGAGATEDVPLNRATVSFSCGPATDEFTQITSGGKLERFRYTGCRLDVEVHWDRVNESVTSDTLREMNKTAATIRAVLRQSEWPLDDENLKWYRVSSLRPLGENKGLDQQRMCDVLTLSYSVDFQVLGDAWPSQA